MIKTHLMGRIWPPGRSGAQRDAKASGKRRDALRRPATPHRRPRSWARSPRGSTGREALVVAGTTARFAPNERAQDRGEMSLYHRDLVLPIRLAAFAGATLRDGKRASLAAARVGCLGICFWSARPFRTAGHDPGCVKTNSRIPKRNIGSLSWSSPQWPLSF